jgi:hypothetical protein
MNGDSCPLWQRFNGVHARRRGNHEAPQAAFAPEAFMGTRLRRFCERPRAWGAAAFFLTVCLLLGHYAVKYGLNVAPSPAGDEFSYDSIGWNLAHGAGYAEGGATPSSTCCMIKPTLLIGNTLRIG